MSPLWKHPRAVFLRAIGLQALLRNGPQPGSGPAASAPKLNTSGVPRLVVVSAALSDEAAAARRAFESYLRDAGNIIGNGFSWGCGGQFFLQKDGPHKKENKIVNSCW